MQNRKTLAVELSELDVLILVIACELAALQAEGDKLKARHRGRFAEAVSIAGSEAEFRALGAKLDALVPL